MTTDDETGSGSVQWIDRLQDETGWDGPEWESDWTATESELGTRLPSSYKRLHERFGPGVFSSFLWVVRDRDPDSVLSWWHKFKKMDEKKPGWAERYFSPYGLYLREAGAGLILWGHAEGVRLYWLADSASDPDTWPVIARFEDEWHQAAVSTPEFVYRAIADPGFEPITFAHLLASPTFQRVDDGG